MLGELIVILAVLITAVYAYLKSPVIKAFMLPINAIVASSVALAYFETLATLIIGYGMFVQIAPAISLAIIFIFAFIILNIISDKLASYDISFGNIADKIVTSLAAAFAGFIIAGVVLITVAMVPIGTNLPYPRFAAKPNSTEPDKTLILNADGFVASLASGLSRGPMSSKKSFAAFHPDFVNEIHLNRIACDKDNLPVAGSKAISVEAAWTPETELLSAADSQPINTSGRKVIVIRAAINLDTIKGGGARPERGTMTFTMSQIRLICKDKDSEDTFGGKGCVVWPIGCLQGQNTLDQKNLSAKLTLKEFDFVFYIPPDTTPVMLQFKQNAAAQVDRLVKGEQIPTPLEVPQT